jgi:hypothetical protein
VAGAPAHASTPCLQHDVERGGRLIGDQELRLQRAGNGDDDALALPAGQLVRIARQRKLPGGQPDALQHLLCQALGVRAVRPGVPADALGDLLADGLERVQRGHRLLEHHADIVAAQAAHLLLGSAEDVGARKTDPPGGLCPLRQQPHDGERRHRFSRARLADQPHDLARLYGQIDVPQDRRAADRQRQVLDLEQAHCRRRSFGSSVSLTPSPMRLRPSTVMTIAMPGTIAW